MFLSVEVSAKSTSLVSEGGASENDDLVSIGGDSDLPGNDLDSSGWDLLDLGNGLVSSGLAVDEMWELDLLSVNLNLEFVLASWNNSDLVLSWEEDNDGLGSGVDVLNKNSDGLSASAVLGENVVASLGGLWIEPVGDIVEGGDVFVLESAHGLGVGSEDSVTDVVEERLGGGEGEDLLDDTSSLDVLELKDVVVFGDEDAEVLLVGGEPDLEVDLSLGDRALWIVILAHVWVEVSLEEVSDLVGSVLESKWHWSVVELDIKDIEGSGLVFSNLHADGGNIESLLFVLFAPLGFWGFLLGPLGHFLSSLEESIETDLVLQVLARSTELKSSFNLDLKVFLEESFSEDNKDVSVHLGWGIIVSFEGNAASWLLL